MDKFEKVRNGICSCLTNPGSLEACKEQECPYVSYAEDTPEGSELFCEQMLLSDTLELLDNLNADASIIRKCREGQNVKYVGRGVVVLNHKWWMDILEKKGEFVPVPSIEDLLLNQQKPVKPITYYHGEDMPFTYRCGHCGHSLDADDHFCSGCGKEIDWDA